MDPTSENVLAWEIFRMSIDQWDMGGRYDFHLAIELLKAFGCSGAEIVDNTWRIRIIAATFKNIHDTLNKEEQDRQEFYRKQRESGVLRG